MRIVPLTLQQANEFIGAHHRHHGPTIGHKFSIGVENGGALVGAAIVGRPVSRHLDDGETLEALRVCTTGTKNAASMLYGRIGRILRDMGYARGFDLYFERMDERAVHEHAMAFLDLNGEQFRAMEGGGLFFFYHNFDPHTTYVNRAPDRVRNHGRLGTVNITEKQHLVLMRRGELAYDDQDIEYISQVYSS